MILKLKIDWSIVLFAVTIILSIVSMNVAVTSYANAEVYSQKNLHHGADRICIADGTGVYCERIFVDIQYTEYIISMFYSTPEWYKSVQFQYQHGWWTDSEYIKILEFGLNEKFTHNWLYNNFDERYYKSFDYKNESGLRQLEIINLWDDIKYSPDFDLMWDKKR